MAEEPQADGRMTDGQRRLVTALIDRYSPVQRILHKSYPAVGGMAKQVLTGDEIEAACLYAACVAAGKYDPAKGSKFATYAGLWMRSLVQKEMRQRLGTGAGEWPTDSAGEQLDPPDDKAEDPSATVERAWTAALVARTLERMRADRSKLLVARYADGRPLAELAEESGTYIQAVHAALQKGRRDFCRLWG